VGRPVRGGRRLMTANIAAGGTGHSCAMDLHQMTVRLDSDVAPRLSANELTLDPRRGTFCSSHRFRIVAILAEPVVEPLVDDA
jgi:hypothetical protein